jgi:hypothetical protein
MEYDKPVTFAQSEHSTSQFRDDSHYNENATPDQKHRTFSITSQQSNHMSDQDSDLYIVARVQDGNAEQINPVQEVKADMKSGSVAANGEAVKPITTQMNGNLKSPEMVTNAKPEAPVMQEAEVKVEPFEMTETSLKEQRTFSVHSADWSPAQPRRTRLSWSNAHTSPVTERREVRREPISLSQANGSPYAFRGPFRTGRSSI